MASTRERAEAIRDYILKERPKANVVGIVEEFNPHKFVIHMIARAGCYSRSIWIRSKSQWNNLAPSTKNLCCKL